MALLTRLAASFAFVAMAVACRSSTSSPHFLTYAGQRNGDMAIAAGKLVREGNCLYVDAGGGGYRDLLALPEGTSWDNGSQTLTIDGYHYPVGSTITVGGGESESPVGIHWATPPDPSCDLSSVWWVGAGLPPGYPDAN